MEDRSTAERVTDELDIGEVNLIVEGSPVDGNVIHTCELSTITIDRELLKGVPGGVYLKPSEVQLFHAESKAPFGSVPEREFIIRKGQVIYGIEKSTHEEAASGM